VKTRITVLCLVLLLTVVIAACSPQTIPAEVIADQTEMADEDVMESEEDTMMAEEDEMMEDDMAEDGGWSGGGSARWGEVISHILRNLKMGFLPA